MVNKSITSAVLAKLCRRFAAFETRRRGPIYPSEKTLNIFFERIFRSYFICRKSVTALPEENTCPDQVGNFVRPLGTGRWREINIIACGSRVTETYGLWRDHANAVEAALYPLDTIKTRLQAARGGAPELAPSV